MSHDSLAVATAHHASASALLPAVQATCLVDKASHVARPTLPRWVSHNQRSHSGCNMPPNATADCKAMIRECCLVALPYPAGNHCEKHSEYHSEYHSEHSDPRRPTHRPQGSKQSSRGVAAAATDHCEASHSGLRDFGESEGVGGAGVDASATCPLQPTYTAVGCPARGHVFSNLQEGLI